MLADSVRSEHNTDGLTRDRVTLAGQVDDRVPTRLCDDSEGRTLLAGLDALSLAGRQHRRGSARDHGRR